MTVAFVAAIAVLQAFLILINLAVAASMGAAFGPFGLGGAWFTAIFVALSFTPVTATLLARRNKSRIVAWYYAAASYWLGLAFFLFGGGAVFYIALTASYAANIYVPPALVGGISFGAFFLVHLYGTLQSGRIATVKIEIAIPGLPASWRGKKIAFISDLHLGCIWKRGFSASIAKKVRAFDPEMLLVGGNLYDGPACDESGIIEPLGPLARDMPRGAYFVTGNHEYFMAEPEKALAAVRAAGMRVLDNESVDVGGLRLAGVDYRKARRRDDFKNAVVKIVPRGGAPTILMKHEPSDLDVARDAGVAFGLFGHTHRGQIWPLMWLTQRIYRGFDYGSKALGSLAVYTSSGAGTWGPPLRLGTRAEIVCITLK